MRSLWEGLGDLRGHQLKLKLLERMANSEAVLEKFWGRAKRGNPNDCWEYRITRGDTYGYGRFSMMSPDRTHSVTLMAHRISYFLAHGSLPDNLMVCHHCDNRKCVNPKHLFLGSDLDNKQDMVSKNRQTYGERQWMHKLTDPLVLSIRKKYYSGGVTFCEIAESIGMSYAATRAAIVGKTWKHLP